jgi:regulator of sigma E protease
MDISIIWTIISFIIIFMVIVIAHEGGHMIIAKANGIDVAEFTVGVGPKLFGFHIKDTYYSLRALPFGGACIFAGEDELEDDEEKEKEEKENIALIDDKEKGYFKNAPVMARIATVLAGPVANVLLAYILGLIVVFVCGEILPVIGDVAEDYPAYEAGLRAGDKIISINGERILNFDEIRLMTITDANKEWNIVYERDGERYETTLTPLKTTQGTFIGVTSTDAETGKSLAVFKYSFYEVRFWLKATFKSLKMLFTGKLTLDDVSGPVGIAQVIDTTIDSTIEYGAPTVVINMVNLALLLSVNLGVMNLLPLPALDGGRLIMYIIELITRKKVPEKVENVITIVGFALLMLLAVVVFINDIFKFFK